MWPFKSWIERLLDGLEARDDNAALATSFVFADRLERASASEVRAILKRLERAVRVPPGADDPITTLRDPAERMARLLWHEALPVDVTHFERIIASCPEPKRRGALLVALGRIGTPDSLDLLARLAAQRPDDEAWADLGIAMIPTVRRPAHRDILFPRLAALLPHLRSARAVMDTANAFEDPPHPLKGHEQTLASHLLSQADEDIRGGAAWTLGLIGARSTTDALFQVAREPGCFVPLEAAQALVRLGDRRGIDVLVRLCGDAKLRHRAVALLQEVARHEIPAAALEPDVVAEDRLRRWLEHPSEYGQAPDAVQLLDKSRRSWPGHAEPLDCRLFRCRTGAREKWDVGLVGPTTFVLFGEELDGRPVDEIYRAYEDWESRKGSRGLIDLVDAETRQRMRDMSGEN
jgi:HEAT repeat protein